MTAAVNAIFIQVRIMSMIRRRSPRAHIVSTRKTAGAIPAPKPITKDLVLQSVLDSGVRRVEFLNQVLFGGCTAPARSIVVTRDDRRLFVDIVGSRPDRTPGEELILDLGLESQGIERVEIGPETIRREPRFTNARLIWEHRKTAVSIRDRERIIQHLAEQGPQTIGRLETAVEISIDVTTAVCALACDDILDIDIDTAPLGRGTRVSIRR